VPQQLAVAIENNFTKGLITESTGLNFPENASTDTDNCEYTLIGDVDRRQGIDLELNFQTFSVERTNKAISTYKWNNAGGDGLSQLLVSQVGDTIYFYSVTSATIVSPLSQNILSSTVSMSAFVANGTTFDPTLECTYADGNGYLFIFHPNCEPVFCSFVSGVVTGNIINVLIRDFSGAIDGIPDQARPSTLSNAHLYNLENQGWNIGARWSATSTTSNVFSVSVKTFTVAAGLSVTIGDAVTMSSPYSGSPGVGTLGGAVSGYTGTTLTVNVYSIFGGTRAGLTGTNWSIVPMNIGLIGTFQAALGIYPSNSDVWWYFKDSLDNYAPATTAANVTISGLAPKGHFTLNAFQQAKGATSGISGITDISTTQRPKVGTWFQGRVWYAGCDASQPASGTSPFYTWSENIYFSQIVNNSNDFGKCYQLNDPTSENLFDLLPTDGGVIQIQGCGSIYKLFSMQNALLVFAANGVWYITGSTGIGFTANDYTIVKLSSVQSISSTSFVNVLGLPIFWNEEGIYKVEPAKQGTGLLSSPLHVNPLEVTPITIGTIATFYQNIPLSSKKYARGDYNPISYVVQWIYKDTEANVVLDRYQFNKIMNFNTVNNSFFPYTASSLTVGMNGINYVAGPGGRSTIIPTFKYLSSFPVVNTTYNLSFADEHREDYTDWVSTGVPSNYISYFITGFKLRGQAIKKFQPQYIQVYSRTNGAASAYKIQGIWNFANDPSSGKWSTAQLITNALTRFDTIFRRHKIRGSGYILQFKIASVDKQPFDIQGWSAVDTVNTGT
jgi:hypothetical protein